MQLIERAYTCKRDALTIRGQLFKTDDTLPRPAIILSHGFMGNWHDMTFYAREFVAMGYIAFACDFCGGSLQSTSDGLPNEMSVLTECRDLEAIIDDVLTREEVCGDTVTLFGASQGGFVSGLVAAKRQEQVKQLIMMFPALCIPDDARRGEMMLCKFDPTDPPEIIHCAGKMTLGRCYPLDVCKIDAIASVSAYQGPVMLIHGTDDAVVNVRYAKAMYKAFAAGQCYLQLIGGANHGFNDQENAYMMYAVRQYLAGRQEVLNISVHVTGAEMSPDGKQCVVSFDGSCDCDAFRGVILNGAKDTQQIENGAAVQLCADYTLEGIDRAGKPCRIHVINRNVDDHFVPLIDTDSDVLAGLNHAQLTAMVEAYQEGLTVRIWSDHII